MLSIGKSRGCWSFSGNQVLVEVSGRPGRATARVYPTPILAHVVGWFVDSSEPFSFIGLAAGLMFVAPFFCLAYTAGRWPRFTGAILVVVSSAFLVIPAPTWEARSLQAATSLVTAG